MSSTSIVKNGEAKHEPVALRGVDAIYESLALRGDISGLKPGEKVAYYRALCERLGLDPMTQPFLPLRLNNKEVLYASRAATDQLARLHSVTREVTKREQINDVYIVTVRASLPSGRIEESIGAVAIGGLKGDSLANALMKGESKAKRRATLSILALGMLDELEVQSIDPKQVEHLQAYEIEDGSAASAADVGAPTSTGAEVDDAVGAPTMTDEDRAQELEHVRLHERLLEEIRTLRDLGIPYGAIQGQLKLVTGETERKSLTGEQLDKAIASFGEWSKQLAEKIRDNK